MLLSISLHFFIKWHWLTPHLEVGEWGALVRSSSASLSWHMTVEARALCSCGYICTSDFCENTQGEENYFPTETHIFPCVLQPCLFFVKHE